MSDSPNSQPNTRTYIRVAILLAVLTAIEVALFYIVEAGPMSQQMANPLLIALAVFKFLVVVGYFMHLKFERPLLSRMFAGGAIAALVLYTVVFFETLSRSGG